MTVETNVNKKTWTCGSSLGPFTFTFTFDSNAEILVYLVAADGKASLLTETTDYTLTGAGTFTGGSITLTAAHSGYTLLALRVLDILQLTSIRNLGKFSPEIHETVFDRLTKIMQQINEQVDRSVKVPLGSSVDPDDLIAQLSADASTASTAASTATTQAGIATTKASEAAASAEAISGQIHDNMEALDAVEGVNTGDQDLSGYAAKAIANVFTKTQTPSRTAITPSASIDWDASATQVLEITLTATRLFNAPTNLVAGTLYGVRLIGAYVPTWNAAYKNISSYACATTATKADFLTFYCSDGTNLELVGIMYNCNGGA